MGGASEDSAIVEEIFCARHRPTAETAAAIAAAHSRICASFLQFLLFGKSGVLVNREPSVSGRSGQRGGCPSGTPSSCKIRWAITSTGSILATASSSLMPSSIRSASISA